MPMVHRVGQADADGQPQGRVGSAQVDHLGRDGFAQAPIGVEVFSHELAALPPAEVGRRCAEAARQILRQARPGGQSPGAVDPSA